MSKIRAALVSTLLATALVGGAVTAGSGAEAKAPVKVPSAKSGPQWCC